MKSISVLPHIGIGPLKLKMSPEQISNAINELLNNFSVPNQSDLQITKETEKDIFTLRYLGSSFFFMVSYKNNQAVEIAVDNEIGKYANITLYEKNVFKLDAEELVNILKEKSACSYDLNDEQLSTDYEFSDIGIRLWREQPFHKKLLLDKAYMEEMSLVIDEMYQYLYFQLIAVK